eukprot:g3757.t1
MIRRFSTIVKNEEIAKSVGGGVCEKEHQNSSYSPWTPTNELKKKNHYFKRMAFLIQTLEDEKVDQIERQIPTFKVGDVLKLRLKVGENENKEEEFVGVCIARKNKSYRSSITLRKTWTPPLGVERIFHLYSPSILSIEVIGSRDYKGRSLYYLRNNPKATMV